MSCKLSDKCDNVFACNVLRPNVELLGCNFYKPKKPMTNEEWLCGLSTEEKAKFLRQIYRDGRDDYVGEWYEQTEKDFEEWLKQPHTIKE